MMFGARHPDLSAAASSLSGAVDTNYEPMTAIVGGSPVIQGGSYDAIYGPRATEEVRWRGHNPADLAEEPALRRPAVTHRERDSPRRGSRIRAGLRARVRDPRDDAPAPQHPGRAEDLPRAQDRLRRQLPHDPVVRGGDRRLIACVHARLRPPAAG